MRPSPSDLLHFFEDLEEYDFENTIDFESIALPSFLSTLGYSGGNIFYEVTLGTENDLTYADAVVAESPQAAPWLIVEARYYPDKSTVPATNGVDDFVFDDLARYRNLADAELSAVLTNDSIAYFDESERIGHHLSDVDLEIAREIFKALKPPSELPTTPPSTQFRDKEYITTDNFRIEISEYEENLEKIENSENNTEKKEALEGVARLLFEGLKDYSIRDMNMRTRSSEIDVIAEYNGPGTRVHSNDRYLLIECKNWSKKVGAKHIRDFRGKVIDAGANCGIVFTKEGITGTDEGKDAMREIRVSFEAYDVIIIHFSLRDLESILNKHQCFYEMIDEKIFNRRFPS